MATQAVVQPVPPVQSKLKPSGQATHRTVILLRDADRQRLDELAEQEGTSSAEVVRRAIHSYQPEAALFNLREQEVMEAAMDQIIASLREASASAERTEKRLDLLQEQLAENKKAAKSQRKTR